MKSDSPHMSKLHCVRVYTRKEFFISLFENFACKAEDSDHRSLLNDAFCYDVLTREQKIL